MKIKILILFFFLSFPNIYIFALQVPKITAEKVAKTLYHIKTGIDKSTIVFKSDTTIYDSSSPVFYVFNLHNNKGFIIIAAEDHVYPILGYSLKGNFSDRNQPPAFKELLENYKDQIVYVRQNNLPTTTEIENAWDQFDKSSRGLTRSTRASAGPLLTTTWDQSCYYNADCPADTNSVTGYCGRVPVGCVATTMAQIMKYHHHPYQGAGSHSYVDSPYGTLSANFTSTYIWANMSNTIASSNPDLAKILFHCGVSVEMDYDPSGSGSYTSDAVTKLISNFNYKSTAQYVTKSSYSTPPSAWDNVLQTELNNSRPMIYRGQGTSGGHAWVCDGYDDNIQGQAIFYHFNWGWSGAYDGYFKLSSLNPGSYSFTQLQAAGIGIEPINTVIPHSDFTSDKITTVVGSPVSYFDQSSNAPSSWNWSFTGGTPSSSTSEDPSITYNTPGIYEVYLTASNVTGTGSTKTKSSYITVYNSASSGYCTPVTSDLNNQFGVGILNVTFNTINNSTGGSVSDYNNLGASTGYLDFSNSQITNVNKNTAYTISVTVGPVNPEEVQVYIDYNNDTDFTDTGENVWGKDSFTGTQSGTIIIPVSTITNTLLRMRVISDFYPYDPTSCANPTYGQAEDYGIYINGPTSTFWDTLATSTDWHSASNWSDGIPDLYTNITIQSGNNQPVLSSNGTCNNLIINSNASLTVNTSDTLVVNGIITLKNNASIIDNGSVFGSNSSQIERSFSQTVYHYITPPVAGQDAGMYNDAYDFFSYNEGSGWVYRPTGNLQVGKGYIISYNTTSPTKTYTGTLNTGNIDVPVTRTNNDGWNLIGNPFPSDLILGHPSIADFIDANVVGTGSVYQTISGTIYLWDEGSSWNSGNGDYAARTITGGTAGGSGNIPGPYIEPGQAFFVQRPFGATDSIVRFSNSMRTNSTNYFYGPDPIIQSLRLDVTNPTNNTNQILISFLEGATQGFDILHDAPKNKANPKLAFYSILEGKDYTIQAFPPLEQLKNYIVPIGLDVGDSGIHIITVAGYDNIIPEHTHVYLEDLYEGNTLDLHKIPTYTFISGKGSYVDRFIIRFVENKLPEDIDNYSLQYSVQIYSYGKDIYVINSANELLKGRIFLYDILGKTILQQELNTVRVSKININEPAGYYIVKLITEKQLYFKKILIE